MAGLRMAKADNEDFEVTTKFLRICESFWDNRNRYSFKDTETDWETWDEDDEDKLYILKVRKELAEEEDCDLEHVDNRLLIYEVVKRFYKKCDCHWNRVTLGAQILIEQVCDPQKDYLDYSPYLEELHVAPEQ
jgi:hypothetical protein